jgi:diaminopimelate decarboxylase
MQALLLAAEKFGTPLYAYEEERLAASLAWWKRCMHGFDAHYALKANANPVLLDAIRRGGFMADAVSPLEVEQALRAGFPAAAITFTAHAPSQDDLALVHARGVEITVDSVQALDRLAAVAPGARVGLRLNLGVGAGHHNHVVTGGRGVKFGIPRAELADAIAAVSNHGLELAGLHQHIGSGILEAQSFLAGADALLEIAAPLARSLSFIDFGGGFGIPYRPEEQALDLQQLGEALRARVAAWRSAFGGSAIMRLQPGRILVASAGTLLTRVIEVKRADGVSFVATDTGAHHLVRPMLYGAWHAVENLSRPQAPQMPVTLTGQLCESGDVLAVDRMLALPLAGDVLAIRDAGAYGYSMASTYNLRPRPAEVLLSDRGAELIRPRESPSSVLA